ncbi:MAG: response regulator transcription factor [Actinomycetia bacterium]|nr:response regulator transcription factor [Actinomycetes bacterium]
MPEGEPIRVAVVDDHEVVRVGLAELLNQEPDCRMVGEAGTVEEALRLMRSTPVDVLLLDIRLPDGSGVDVCRQWKAAQPDTHVIMLTSFGDDDLLFSSLEAGAAGYLLKNARGRTVLDAVRTVAQGGSILDPAVADKVLRRATTRNVPHDPLDDLTEQERRILELIAAGLTNREIGEQVYLSEKTVKHYVSNILSKLGLNRRAEAAAYLARREAQERKPAGSP